MGRTLRTQLVLANLAGNQYPTVRLPGSTTMRDRRFIAKHRGGPLEHADHVILARWAADCAESVLPYYTRAHSDPRLGEALGILRQWAGGEVKTGPAMVAARAAHVIARATEGKSAVAAARAVGQAVGTAHAADHSMGALIYALKARQAEGLEIEEEFSKRLGQLPAHLRSQVAEGIQARLPRLSSKPQT